MSKLLELRNVTKEFSGGTVALDDITLSIDGDRPAIIAVAGESGSGKTTLGLITLGFMQPSQGDVYYREKLVTKLSKDEQVQFRKEVQAVFQDPFATYNPFYKVDHIFEVAIDNFKLAGSEAEKNELIQNALESVGLRPREILGRFPHQLSGGQRQRLVVARALMLRPKILIADEPVSMVDASLRATILESLRTLRDEYGIPILYITHDLTTAYHVSDTIIVLYKGSIMEAGNVDRVITDPQHPYTQLLIDSIPWPDLNLTWGQQEIIAVDGESAQIGVGCKFAPRCPKVMDVCSTKRPPLFKANEDRVAACFLYEDKPVLAEDEIEDLLASTAARGELAMANER